MVQYIYLDNNKTPTWPERQQVMLLLFGAVLLTFQPGVVECERFLMQPQDAVVSRGQTHVLHCTVEDRVGEVQWLRDGFGFGPGDVFEGFPRYRIQRNDQRGEYNLVISEITVEDDALFECQVGATESTQGLASRKAKLTVQVPPDAVVIGDGGVTYDVMADRRQALTCHAVGGKPAPTISWEYTGGEAIDLDPGVEVEHVTPDLEGSGGAVSRLLLTPRKQDDGRELVCRVINAAMTEAIQVSAKLRVLYEPRLEMTATPSGRLQERESFQLTCTSDANPDQVTWRWLLDGSAMPGERSNTLLLDSVSYELDGRQLACEATNGVGTTRLDYTVDVEYGPRFVTEPQSQAADVGDDVTLTCQVDGNPTPTVYWRRRGDEQILGRQGSLRLTGVTSDQFATYTCSASSVGRSTVSRDVHLLRNGEPIIVSNAEQTGRRGATANIECLVKAIPPPETVTWTKNGQPVDFDNMPRYKVREKLVSDGLLSVLQISDVQDSDFATYNCSAYSSNNSTYLPIKFSKKATVPWIYWYILIGVGAGIFLIIVIIVIIIAIIAYRRRKSAVQSESDSGSSEDSVDASKSNHIGPDIKVEYSQTNAVDDWRTDLIPSPRYSSPHPPQSDYSELRYPRKEPVNLPSYDGGHYGPPDVYRQRPHSTLPTVFDNPYGTFPRGMSYTQQPTGSNGVYGPVYGSDIYATVGRPRRQYWPSPVAGLGGPAVHSVSPADSRLSTNV